MAPTTRLTIHPERRIDYSQPSVAAARRNDISNPSVDHDEVGSHSPPPTRARRVVAKKECDICADEKPESQFPSPQEFSLCDHFLNTCNKCMDTLIVMKISDRQLGEDQALLECTVPECGRILEYHEVQQIASNDVFEEWTDAIFNFFLRSNMSYISCLNPECGLDFDISCDDGFSFDGLSEADSEATIEDRAIEVPENEKSKVDCPYCAASVCIDCSRPWHEGRECDPELQIDNDLSEASLIERGGKCCPKCSTMIEKNLGCDHMHCQWPLRIPDWAHANFLPKAGEGCGHNFCWQCQAEWTDNTQHEDGCPHKNRIPLHLRMWPPPHIAHPGMGIGPPQPQAPRGWIGPYPPPRPDAAGPARQQ